MNINTWSRRQSHREAAFTAREGASGTERGKDGPWFLFSFCPPVFRERFTLAASCWKPAYTELGSEVAKVYFPSPHSLFNKSRGNGLVISLAMTQALSGGAVYWEGKGVKLEMCSVCVQGTGRTLLRGGGDAEMYVGALGRVRLGQ